MSMIGVILKGIKQAQQYPFKFSTIPEIQEFLNKAVNLDPEQLFQISKKSYLETNKKGRSKIPQ
jgi:hypothetical protein